MKYRVEIDGLRSIAVLPVILFHAGFDLFRGGFIGVDVFFVISGYLITSLLINELENGQFSILRFYERRARRLLPALYVMMICCIPFAWAWMLPSEFADFAQSLIAVVLFISNVLFWRESGYFAPAAELYPLLHTWSLAVEEQYYVVFPVFLFALWRFGRTRVFWAVIVFAALSLIVMEWAWRQDGAILSSIFYLAPTRAWELLAGSICAFLAVGKPQRTSNLWGALGLAMIAFSVFWFGPLIRFPSVYTVIPVLGACLIILFGGQGTHVARLLSLPPLVGIGLISYSTYLWHQPLFAFAKIRSLHEPTQSLVLLLAALSLVLGYLSWRYVEQPFRRKPNPLLRKRNSVFAVSATIAAAFIAFGLAGLMSKGLPQRFSPASDISRIEMAKLPNLGLHEACSEGFTDVVQCRTSDQPEILLWGDSYAMHLVGGLVASDPKVALQQHTLFECAPTLGISYIPTSGNLESAKFCLDFNNKVFDWLKHTSSVRYVVLSSNLGILKRPIIRENGELVEMQDNGEVSQRALLETIKSIRQLGRKVVLV